MRGIGVLTKSTPETHHGWYDPWTEKKSPKIRTGSGIKKRPEGRRKRDLKRGKRESGALKTFPMQPNPKKSTLKVNPPSKGGKVKKSQLREREIREKISWQMRARVGRKTLTLS